jgi:hypothetical protein
MEQDSVPGDSSAYCHRYYHLQPVQPSWLCVLPDVSLNQMETRTLVSLVVRLDLHQDPGCRWQLDARLRPGNNL